MNTKFSRFKLTTCFVLLLCFSGSVGFSNIMIVRAEEVIETKEVINQISEAQNENEDSENELFSSDNVSTIESELIESNISSIMSTVGDNTNPEADLATLSVSPKIAKPGDTVTAKIKGIDEGSGVKYIHFTYIHENGAYKQSTIDYPNEEGYYVFDMTIDEQTQPGRWELYSIGVYDVVDNKTYYYRDDIDLSTGDFEVDNHLGDNTNPEADLTTLSVSPKIAKPGDTVTAKIKGIDEGSGVKYIHFTYIHENGAYKQNTIDYPNEEGYYVFDMTIDEQTQPGRWELYSIGVYDVVDNKTYYYRDDIDLSTGDFEVDNHLGDNTNPEADLTTLSVTPKIAKPGDTVTAKIKGIDEGSGVKYIHFTYIHENGAYKQSTIEYPNEEGYYVFDMTIDEQTQPGKWELYSIGVYDVVDNKTYYYRDDIDLSTGDFEVRDISIPGNHLEVEYILKDTRWNYKTVDTDVYVGPDAILTIDGNVKINGNLKILGAVISYGDLTVRSVYANSMNYGYSDTIKQGSLNVRSGIHNITNLIVSSEPIDYIPIEITSPNIVNSKRILPLLEGSTLPIGDLYVEGKKVDYNINGTFTVNDLYVGSKQSIEIKVIDIFGKAHIKVFELMNKNEKILIGIEIKSKPSKNTYLVGQSIDLTGLKIEAFFDSDEVENIDITDTTISGFDSSKEVENHEVTIEYMENTATFNVNIVSKKTMEDSLQRLNETYNAKEASAMKKVIDDLVDTEENNNLKNSFYSILEEEQKKDKVRIESASSSSTNIILSTNSLNLLSIPEVIQDDVKLVQVILNSKSVEVDEIQTYQEKLDNKNKIIVLYDMSLVKIIEKVDGSLEEVLFRNDEIKGTLELRIAVPKEYLNHKNLVVIYVDKQGKLVELDTISDVVDGIRYLNFGTDHFSLYGIMAVDSEVTVEDTTETEAEAPVSESNPVKTESESEEKAESVTSIVKPVEKSDEKNELQNQEQVPDSLPKAGTTKEYSYIYIGVIMVIAGVVFLKSKRKKHIN